MGIKWEAKTCAYFSEHTFSFLFLKVIKYRKSHESRKGNVCLNHWDQNIFVWCQLLQDNCWFHSFYHHLWIVLNQYVINYKSKNTQDKEISCEILLVAPNWTNNHRFYLIPQNYFYCLLIFWDVISCIFYLCTQFFKLLARRNLNTVTKNYI